MSQKKTFGKTDRFPFCVSYTSEDKYKAKRGQYRNKRKIGKSSGKKNPQCVASLMPQIKQISMYINKQICHTSIVLS